MSPWIERPIGIDLGTTNSSSALLDLDGRRILLSEDAHGRSIIPSIVGHVAHDDRIITGFEAWNRRGLEPEPIQSIKRKMGLDHPVSLAGEDRTPTEISAEILRALVRHMRSYLERQGEDRLRIERAVITVPAYFDAPQIEATRKAGELSGLDVLALLQEPTAACMYCAWKRDLHDGLFLVYDIGGGTFDVSIIRCLYGEYQVLGIHGDNYLGGDDFDRRLAEHFRKHLVAKGYKLDLDIADNPDDATRFLLLQRIAQETKEALSTQPVQYVARRDIFRDQAGTLVTLDLELSRDTWNTLMEDFIASTIRCCNEALARANEAAGITLADIDHVLLVGGSTRVPLIQQRVAEAFCGEGKSKAEAPIMEAPDSCVALGAAIHAANLGGVRIGDDEANIHVALSSALSTQRDTARLVGELAGDNAKSVQGILLKDAAGATLAVESLDTTRRFKLNDIPLLDEGSHALSLELLSNSGATLCELPLTLYRGMDAKRTGSALSNPTVLAKDIYLEVARNGALDRKVLIRRGRSLPASESYQVYTGDQSGAVLLTLLQNRFPISTLHLEVPSSLPVGSPVKLEVQVDEKMVITASGEVAGQNFWAQIEPPPPKSLKNWDEIETLLDDAERIGNELWGHEARVFQVEIPFLITSIREAARTDPDKLTVLVSRLEANLEHLRGLPGDLQPSFSRFTHVLDNVRRIVFRADQMMGLTFDGWRERLDTLLAEGKAAWEARDQGRWTRLYTQLQALYETVSQEEWRFVRTDSKEYVGELFAAATRRSGALRTRIAEVILPAAPETRKLHQQELDAISMELREKVSRPLEALAPRLEEPDAIRSEIEAIIQHIKHLETRLAKLPSLGVVVTHD